MVVDVVVLAICRDSPPSRLPYFIPIQRNFPTGALTFFIKPRRRAIAAGFSDITYRLG